MTNPGTLTPNPQNNRPGSEAGAHASASRFSDLSGRFPPDESESWEIRSVGASGRQGATFVGSVRGGRGPGLALVGCGAPFAMKRPPTPPPGRCGDLGRAAAPATAVLHRRGPPEISPGLRGSLVSRTRPSTPPSMYSGQEACGVCLPVRRGHLASDLVRVSKSRGYDDNPPPLHPPPNPCSPGTTRSGPRACRPWRRPSAATRRACGCWTSGPPSPLPRRRMSPRPPLARAHREPVGM